jgi:branched-chain amino acid transport system permease protein
MLTVSSIAKAGWPGFLVAGSIILVVPHFVSEFGLSLFITTGAVAISAIGLVLLYGFAHQLALGQAAFCVIGAYGSGLLTARLGWDPTLAAVVSAAVSMAIAYAIGRPILHLRGYVLAMGSLAVQLILIHLAIEWLDVTGGSMGLTGVPRFGIAGFTIQSDVVFYYFTWALVLLAVFACRNIDRSRVGRALRALAASEAGAASVGIDIARHKIEMFVLSAGLASVAGSLMAHYLRLIEPQMFNVQYSLNLLVGVIVGGLTSPWGGPVGAVVLALLREAMRVLSLPLVELLIVGVITIAVLVFFPTGVMGMLNRLLSPRVKKGSAQILPAVNPTAVAPPYSIDLAIGSDPLVQVIGASRTFGSLRAVSAVDFMVPKGSITALLGPNGAGKTTLFNLISGQEKLDSGRVIFAGKDMQELQPNQIARLGIARTFQLLQLFDGLTVVETVMCGRQRFASSSLAGVVVSAPSYLTEEKAMRGRAMATLEFLGLSSLAEMDPKTLPFGLQRQVELARALALEPALLLMDEPASGLNDAETEELAATILKIRRAGTTVLLVEHDVRLVMGLADHIVVMDRGVKIAEGQPEEVRRMPVVIQAYLGSEAA